MLRPALATKRACADPHVPSDKSLALAPTRCPLLKLRLGRTLNSFPSKSVSIFHPVCPPITLRSNRQTELFRCLFRHRDCEPALQLLVGLCLIG